MAPDSLANLAEYTVAELSQAVKRTVEGAFGRVRVRGEVGRVTRAASGHMYLSLKDDRAVLDGVCWRDTAARLRHRPEQGLEVIAIGRLSTYPGRSSYQLVIEHLEPAGIGALMALLEKRRAALAAEGLFDDSRKRALPFLPDTIGVVTSPTGAAIRDIMHRLHERFPRHVLIWPVQVQGEAAAGQVAAAIRGFNALGRTGPVPRPDLLIVARGGGSIEDLWAFNEVAVVRAAAESAIPLVSAIGHETDRTLIDFAADRRAPTPSAAAEMAVPVRGELLARLRDDERRLGSAAARVLDRLRGDLAGLARGLAHPSRLVEQKSQDLDNGAWSLRRVMALLLQSRSGGVRELAHRLRHPRETIADKRAGLARAAAGLSARALRERLAHLEAGLERAGRDHERGIAGRFEEARRRLAGLARGLVHPSRLVEQKSQDLDNGAWSLRRVMALLLQSRSGGVRELAHRLRHPRETIADKRAGLARATAGLSARALRERLAHLEASLERAGRDHERGIAGRFEEARRRLAEAHKLLESYSYRGVLARGYAVVRDARRGLVASAAELRPSMPLAIEFHDGTVAAAAAGAPAPDDGHASRRRRRGKAPPSRDGEQGSLF